MVVLTPVPGSASEASPPVVLSDGWTMRWGDHGVWESFDVREGLPRNGPDDVFWLRRVLPERSWDDPVLWVGIFRPFEAELGGASIYQAGKMFFFSLISYLLFGGLLMYISIKLVENADRITNLFRTYNTIVWPLVILMVMSIVVVKVVSVRKRG